jgi:hypothetical protein
MIEGFEVLSHLISLLQAFPGARLFILGTLAPSERKGGSFRADYANKQLRFPKGVKIPKSVDRGVTW